MQRILLALCLALLSPAAFAQAYVAALTVTVPGQTPLAGLAAWIDMSSGIFQPVVTPSQCAACENTFPAVRLLDTKSFAMQNHTLVAVTANAGFGLGQYVNGTCQSWMSGLIISDGALVSPPQWHGLELYFTDPKTPRITDGDLPPLGTVRWAVSGTTTVGNDCGCGQFGTLLVKAGQIGSCAVPASQSAAARGAAGVFEQWLILAMVQGGDGGKTNGLTTAQWGGVLLQLGASDAINFDGGGSSAFVWNPDGATLDIATPNPFRGQLPRKAPVGLSNVAIEWKKPSGTYEATSGSTFRPIYASLGIRYIPTAKSARSQ